MDVKSFIFLLKAGNSKTGTHKTNNVYTLFEAFMVTVYNKVFSGEGEDGGQNDVRFQYRPHGEQSVSYQNSCLFLLVPLMMFFKQSHLFYYVCGHTP